FASYLFLSAFPTRRSSAFAVNTLSLHAALPIFISHIHEFYSIIMLERTHLAIVQEVEKQGSLTAAANVLCVTQSALSHSMKKLRSEEHTSELQSRENLVCRLLLEKKNVKISYAD